uniref:Uncharacterized protein n=1 Tax=Trichuris muris TaxID=70415 RepID=A0A5S6QWQ2_TRIMR
MKESQLLRELDGLCHKTDDYFQQNIPNCTNVAIAILRNKKEHIAPCRPNATGKALKWRRGCRRTGVHPG